MAGYTPVIKKSMAIYLEGLRDDLASRRDKEYFWPNGTQVYTGKQGSGKTISAVKHVLSLKFRYPKSLLVSNLILNKDVLKPRTFESKEELLVLLNEIDYTKEYIVFQSVDDLHLVLVLCNNGKYGVIYLIDEIHTYFNALESKNIPMYVFTEISQQRKQRKLIIGTSQLFLRMAKPLREQCDNLIMCKTKFGFWTFQTAYDGMTLDQDYDGKLAGNVKKRGWFFQTRDLRSSFDTYQKVSSAAIDMSMLEPVSKTELRVKGKKVKFK